MLKFNQKITDFQYILSFDIAKNISGYSLTDIVNNKIICAGIIDTKKSKLDFVWDYFYTTILEIINSCANIVSDGKLLITKERLPNQNGKFSTIDTLQGLAQAHSIFDLAVHRSGHQFYDYDGVHSVSVKSYFKTLTGLEKPQKEDISEYIQKKYKDFNFDEYPLDVTDSVAVAITLVEKKYNSDIDERIKMVKKEIKNAKAKAKINKLNEEIVFLQHLKI